MNEISTIKSPRAGRPTKEQAEARHAFLLDRAIDHFLEKGFERATVEGIASDVNMTKRTVYARYPDKEALFRAAVERAIERFAISQEIIEATLANDFRQTLTNIAMLRINLVSTEQGLKLQRIINTESYRFPDIYTTYFKIAALPTSQFLTKLLKQETDAGRLAIDNPTMAAVVFMSMVVSGPVSLVVSGNPLTPDELKERVAFGVNLFLEGAKPR